AQQKPAAKAQTPAHFFRRLKIIQNISRIRTRLYLDQTRSRASRGRRSLCGLVPDGGRAFLRAWSGNDIPGERGTAKRTPTPLRSLGGSAEAQGLKRSQLEKCLAPDAGSQPLLQRDSSAPLRGKKND